MDCRIEPNLPYNVLRCIAIGVQSDGNSRIEVSAADMGGEVDAKRHVGAESSRNAERSAAGKLVSAHCATPSCHDDARTDSFGKHLLVQRELLGLRGCDSPLGLIRSLRALTACNTNRAKAKSHNPSSAQSQGPKRL